MMKEQETALITQITRGVTHELMNILATIKECSGLMEDIIALSGKSIKPHREKLTKAMTGISEQVDRGVEVSADLNRFAHSLQNKVIDIDVNNVLDRVIHLMHYFARQNKIELTVKSANQQLFFPANPFEFQMILVTCILHCLENSPQGSKISLQAKETKSGTAIQFITGNGSDSKEIEKENQNGLGVLIEKLGSFLVEVTPLGVSNNHDFEIIIPFVEHDL